MEQVPIDWDLHRQGEIDKKRHHDKVKEAIGKNLKELVNSGDIVVRGGRARVRVAIKELKEFRLRHGKAQTGTGAGQPQPKKGDVIGRKPGGNSGQGTDAGEEHDSGHYEAEIGLEDVAAVFFDGLELPNLREVEKTQVPSEAEEPEALDKRGALSQLDYRRTIIENIKRNAMQGKAYVGDFTDDDLRFRKLMDVPQYQDQVVVILMRDYSGSMGDRERFLSRATAFWTIKFLEYKYRKQVHVVHILHDTEAFETNQEDFFHRAHGGGTVFSSAYKLMAKLITEKYHPSAWNIYAMHFTDGDNHPLDAHVALDTLRESIDNLNLFCYCHIDPRDALATGGFTRGTGFTGVMQKDDLGKHQAVEIQQISNQADVVAAVRHFFRPRGR